MRAQVSLPPWRVWGLRDSRVDVVLTVVTGALLVVSRFALLARGPWEWDEMLFARAVLKFELAAHFPHPPGFPGWVGIGHLLTPLAGEPLVALQWASAAFSVALFWPLAALGRRVAPAPVAAAAAVALLLAPGPWLYGVRGFSSTGAAFFAVAAAAVAVRRTGTGWPTWFTVLVAVAFLIRPILAPPLAVLWIGVAGAVRPVRRLVPGVLLAALLLLVAIAAMVRAEGGWDRFVAPFAAHTEKHFSRLGENRGVVELGLVKGLGGWPAAAVATLLAGCGLLGWARRVGRPGAALWAVVLAVAVLQLLLLQNRTYGRYAVPVQVALAPLVAGGVALLPVPTATVGLLVAGGLLAAESFEPVLEQHERQLAGWRAVDAAARAARGRDLAVVVEPELHPFASYLWHLEEARGREMPALVLSPWAPEPFQGARSGWIVATVHDHMYLPPLGEELIAFGPPADALVPLTQQRFLRASVSAAPPLPVAGWWPVERLASGEPFLWGGPEAVLLLPPLACGGGWTLDLRPAPGTEPLTVEVEDQLATTVEGRSARRFVQLPPQLLSANVPTRVVLRRAHGYPPGGGDERPLAVQLFVPTPVGPGVPWGGRITSASERERLHIGLDGGYPVERFPGAGPGIWLEPRARLTLRAGPGRVRLRLWAPRPTPAGTRIAVAGTTVVGPLAVGAEPMLVDVTVPADAAGDGIVSVELASAPFVPAAAGGSSDSRALGVVLSHLWYLPSPTSRPAWALPLTREGNRRYDGRSVGLTVARTAPTIGTSRRAAPSRRSTR